MMDMGLTWWRSWVVYSVHDLFPTGPATFCYNRNLFWFTSGSISTRKDGRFFASGTPDGHFRLKIVWIGFARSSLSFSPMECPDTLALDHALHTCYLECIYPFYTKAQYHSMFVIDSTFACVGFVLCYFYCFTALFRPVMLHKQSVIVFWMHLCMGLFCVSYFLPLFLGERYVFCDSATSLATQNNGACIANGFITVYFSLSFFVWLVIFNVHMALRLFLFRLPKHIMWLYFFLAFGTWSALTIIIGFSLGFMAYSPGGPGCMFFKDSTSFMFGMIVSVFYVCNALLFLSMVLIIYRLLRLRSATGTPWRVMLTKHFRLLMMWAYHLVFVVLFTVSMAYIQRALSSEAVFERKITEYILCVYTFGAENCTLYDVPVFPFGLIITFRMVQSFYPIMLFLVFGARKSMIRFWKEYLLATWRNKRMYLQFTPPFDPLLSASESRTTREEDEVEEDGPKLSSNALRRIKRAIQDL